nr:DUF3653 domain-containing protein [Vibrio jasicida]
MFHESFRTLFWREFSPKGLGSFVFWRDEHRQLVEKFGHIDQPKVYPAKENVLPFKGGRRMKAAQWIPSKLK